MVILRGNDVYRSAWTVFLLNSRIRRDDAYAWNRTFFHHNRLAPEAICLSDAGKSGWGSDAGKKCREKYKEQVQIKKQNCELNRLQLVLPLTESRYHDPRALPSTCKQRDQPNTAHHCSGKRPAVVAHPAVQLPTFPEPGSPGHQERGIRPG